MRLMSKRKHMSVTSFPTRMSHRFTACLLAFSCYCLSYIHFDALIPLNDATVYHFTRVSVISAKLFQGLLPMTLNFC